MSSVLAKVGALDSGAEEKQRRAISKLTREIKPLIEFLADKRVQEIFVNPDETIWVDRAGEARVKVGTMPASRLHDLLCTIASTLGTVITRDRPFIDGELVLDGSRISGEIPPMSIAPSLRIRKHAEFVKPLSYYVESGGLSERGMAYLIEAILARKNIVIVGGTGSGKTFLANTLLHEIARLTPEDRVLSVEETRELRVSSPDSVSWYTHEPAVDMHLCLIRALRATPKRIVVGEVRGGEAWQMLKMWNTGHEGGLCTIHSNRGALDGLFRLEQAALESPEVKGREGEWVARLIGDVVHVLINIVNDQGARRIARVVCIEGRDSDRGEYRFSERQL